MYSILSVSVMSKFCITSLRFRLRIECSICGLLRCFVSHKLRNHFISMPSAIRLQANVRLNACGRALSGSYIPTVAQYFSVPFNTLCGHSCSESADKKCVVFCFFVFNTFLHICKQFVFHLNRHKYFLFVTALTGDNE